MSGTVLVAPPVGYIDATGIHEPAYSDVLAYCQQSYQAIYGSDVYLGNDSQDGQLLAIFAAAINDVNSATIAAYNSYSPSTAQGTGLSSVVKINGIARLPATNSQVGVTLTGTAGTTISGGTVTDTSNQQWLLPTPVTIPPSGTIDVTAIAQNSGAVYAAPGAVANIGTPTRGWQTASNANAATPGVNAESDAGLRRRQASSTAGPSQTVLGGILGAIANLAGVLRYMPYDNDTNATDINGVPSHSIALVVEGGAVQDVVNAIGGRKSPGTGTYGTTSGTYTDAYGIPATIRFFQPSYVPIAVNITIRALTGYTSLVGGEIVAALVAYLTTLPIGQSVFLSRLYVPANLVGPAASPISPNDAGTYDITAITIGRAGQTIGASDVTLAFTEVASATTGGINLVVT